MVPADMASSSDDDDKDKATDSENEASDEAPEEAEGSSDEGSEGSEEEGSEEEGAEEESAPAKASKEPAKAAKEPAKAAKAAALDAALGAKKEPAKTPAPPPSAGLGKSVSLFIGVVGGISLLMLLLGGERGVAGPAAPQWKEGDTVEVDVTLVSTDRQELACASGTELKGLHCGFESQGKRWSKGDPNDDKKTLRPYSTTNGINFLGAGLWTDPGLTEGKLPTTRFAVKCKLNVAGKMPRADVRWREGESFNSVSDWFTGSVSDCKLSSVQN